MPSTDHYEDFTSAVASIQGRTDAAEDPVDDVSGEELRLLASILTEGIVTADAYALEADAGANMDVDLGSGSAKADIACVHGTEAGQGPYLVRLDDAAVTLTVPAAEPAAIRTDEVWLVVADQAYDSGSLTLPRVGYRKGDAGGANPGPDTGWTAALLLWRISVPAGATNSDQCTLTDMREVAKLDLQQGYLELAGGTLTGSLVLPGNASADLQAVPRQQVVLKAGDTMTGALTVADDLFIDGVRLSRSTDDRLIIHRSGDGKILTLGPAAGGDRLGSLELKATSVTVPSGGTLAITDDDGLTVGGADVARIAKGTYAGNGAGARTIALPFTPAFVAVSWNDGLDGITGYSGVMTGSSVPGVNAKGNFSPANSVVTDENRPRLTTNGFMVAGGDNDQLNASGITYTYMAIG